MMSSLLSSSEVLLANCLKARQIRFGLSGSQVRVLKEPSQFYEELKMRLRTAQNRVTLSALYLGTGKLEAALLESLLHNPHQPRTQILLDYFRGTRINPSDGFSSVKFLHPLMKSSPGSTRICLYQTPSLGGVLKSLAPQRYNETIGLQHIKVYVFDNSVIISGANLSGDYFTNRQDRYIVIEDCQELADYFEELIQIIGDFSFELQEDGSLNWSKSSPCIEEKKSEYIHEFRSQIFSFLSRREIENSPSEGLDTEIYPSIQLGNIGIYDDSEFTSDILRSGSPMGLMKFGTGYFNLTDEYINIILKETGNTKYDILMAHPLANGFYNAKGPAGGIPSAYTLISSQFYDKIKSLSQTDRIRMFEYQRPKWTFHGKGLWYAPSSTQAPIFTLVGSPNFGYRSVHRDIEAQIGICTKNPSLRESLAQEAHSIFAPSNLVDGDTFQRRERTIPLWVRGVVRLARNFF